jgi:hypothetical protein
MIEGVKAPTATMGAPRTIQQSTMLRKESVNTKEEAGHANRGGDG